MTVRFVRQFDARYGITRSFWLADVEVRTPEGQRRRARRVAPVATQRGAEAVERRLRDELLAASATPTAPVQFATFAADWLRLYPSAAGNRPSSRREKEIHTRVHLVPAFGALTLEAVDGEAVDSFIAKLFDAGRSAKTIVNITTTLRRMLASAVEWKLLETMPPVRRLRVPEAQTRWLSCGEASALLRAAASERERTLLLFALKTGARAGEIIALRWQDLEPGYVTLCRSSTRGIVGTTKSGRMRRVPLISALAEALGTHPRVGELVFCHPDGSELSLNALHRCLHRAIDRAGLGRIAFHSLRHSFASQLVLLGVPLRQVQMFLGHSSLAMTSRYAHLAPSYEHAWMARLEEHGSAVHDAGLLLPHAGATVTRAQLSSGYRENVLCGLTRGAVPEVA